MKKKGLLLFFALALLALLLVVYFVFVPMMNRGGGEDTPAEETEMLADYKDSDMTKLAFSARDTGVSLSFNYKTGVYAWYYDADGDFPVNQTILANMAKTVASMPVTRRLGSDEISRADCGLDNPAYTITAYYGGKAYTYRFGDYNAFTSCYYAETDGEDAIFLVSVDIESAFDYKLLGLAQWDTIPTMTADNVSAYEVADAISTKTVEDEAAIKNLTSLYTADVVDFKPDEQRLKDYGLDSPFTTITVHYTENKAVQNDDGSVASQGVDVQYELKLQIGALTETDDTLRYVIINDSPLISTMYNDTLQTLIDAAN